MTHPPEELLSRYDRIANDASERAEIARHLAGCASCRRALARYREIDRALETPPPEPSAFDALVTRLEETSTRMRRAAVRIGAAAGLELVAGIGALVLLGVDRVVVGILAGLLLSDVGLLVGVALVARSRAERYEEVSSDWARGRDAWWTHLVAEARASLFASVSAGLGVCLGVLMLGLGLARTAPMYLAVGCLCLAVGGLGLAVHPRRRRRARRELAAFDELFPRSTGG